MSDKKKIGILTFHNAHNYGAVLQAYALKTKLNRMGHEASVLNYQNKYIARNYRKVLHIDFWKRDILPSRWGKVVREVRDVFYGLKEWQKQWNVFEEFIADKLLDGDTRQLSLEEVVAKDCDVYVLGSDQIWARELTHGMDPAYFGQFAPKKKKISYAASVPNGSVPENEKPFFKQYLQSLSHISVREEKLAQSLRDLTGREINTVIDPTLLLEREDYEPLLYEKPLKQGDYVFAYFVVENETVSRCAKKVAELLGCELIELHYKKTPTICGKNMIFDAGPSEFLTYIRDAKMVVTNSFHGTVFSILFQKKFYSVYKENGRIDNLLSFLGLEERHITEERQIQLEKEIDYGQSDKGLQEYRQQSVDFLMKGIEE
ncbi:MAG: polysaccharide pyruvyl transferase family protein [Roseburia sp.]|nr:polysaccharide pyruvyl transferase family protein [Roseburia sp.]